MAAGLDNVDMIHFLVSAGADLESLDDSRLTPLHVACNMGKRETAVELVQMGADVMSQDNVR